MQKSKTKEYQREYYLKNRDRILKRQSEYEKLHKEKRNAHRKTTWRGWHLQNRYGITVEQYKEMFEKQGGLCAICGKPEQIHANLSVDHCHISGKVRGLLCTNCNRAIGLLGDNKDILRKAIEYLG